VLTLHINSTGQRSSSEDNGRSSTQYISDLVSNRKFIITSAPFISL